MSETLKIKYFAKKEDNVKLATSAYEDTTGYDLYSAEQRAFY